MRIGFGSVVITAGITGILSFISLALAIGTEYWYIIEDKRSNQSDPERMHSGLWVAGDDGTVGQYTICSLKLVNRILGKTVMFTLEEFDFKRRVINSTIYNDEYVCVNEKQGCVLVADAELLEVPGRFSEAERRMQTMHNVIAILLPLSLVLLVFGGICGLFSSLAQSRNLLTGSASYFLFCSLLTLSGVSLYISYSKQALEETERRMGPEEMAQIHTSFGWSMGIAWLSFILEVITGLLMLIAAKLAQLTQYQETMGPMLDL